MADVVDVSGLVEHIARFRSELKPQWRQLGGTIATIIRQLLIEQMDPPGAGIFNDGNRLRRRSDTLINSFMPGKKWNVTKLVATDAKVEFVNASAAPYLGIQEHGGFIADRGNMEEYFWAKYIETHLEEWRRIALAVKRDGGVRLKGRHTVERVEAAMVDKLNRIGDAVFDIIGFAWMRTA